MRVPTSIRPRSTRARGRGRRPGGTATRARAWADSRSARAHASLQRFARARRVQSGKVGARPGVRQRAALTFDARGHGQCGDDGLLVHLQAPRAVSAPTFLGHLLHCTLPFAQSRVPCHPARACSACADNQVVVVDVASPPPSSLSWVALLSFPGGASTARATRSRCRGTRPT